MLAVILAGGFGTRLRPLTYTTPKPLLPVANKPLVEHAIAGLPPEVDEVALAVGYKADLIADHFSHHPIPGRRVHVITEDRPLGTGGAIAHAVEAMGGVEETFWVRNADLVDTLPASQMLELHRRAKALGTISLWRVADPSPFGVAKLAGTRIEHFVEKPKREDAPSDLINAGTYILEPEVMDYIPEQPEGELSMERVVFPELLATGRGMHGFLFTGHWIDCGRPDSYLEAHRLLLPKGATLGIGARMRGQAKGFACLGANAAVEEGAALEDSVLLKEAHVGRDAVIARSILGVGARVGAGAELEDVVLGDGADVPARAKLKGARVPEVVA
jgi:mannose-1-phosphate guanylyltransferase